MTSKYKNILDRINYVNGYVINETPKYRPLIDDSSFDAMPEGWNMKEADAPAPPPEAAAAPAPAPSGSTAPPTPAPAAAPVTPPAPAAPQASSTPSISPELPPAAVTPDTTAPEGGLPPEAAMGGEPNPAANQSTDQLQADVLRFQLDAMKKMTQKIDQLEGMLSGLNAQNAELHKEVDKVRDPSDIEKFNNRKVDSSPYYFNLNDMWNDNTFQARMDNFNSKGIVKTEDGYVADFDKLPKLTPYEVKNSFDQV